MGLGAREGLCVYVVGEYCSQKLSQLRIIHQRVFLCRRYLAEDEEISQMKAVQGKQTL